MRVTSGALRFPQKLLWRHASELCNLVLGQERTEHWSEPERDISSLADIPEIANLDIQLLHLLIDFPPRRGLVVDIELVALRTSVQSASYDEVRLSLGTLELDFNVTSLSTNLDKGV